MAVLNNDDVFKKFNFIQRSSWLFIAKLIHALTLLIITVIYSRQLSFESYGVFQSIWVISNISIVLFGFGAYSLVLSSNVYSLILFVKNNVPKVAGFYLLLLAIVTTFIFNSLPDASTQLYLSVLSLIIIQTVSLIYESIFIKAQKEAFIFFLSLLYSVLYFGWHLYNLSGNFDINYLISGLLFLGVLRLVTYVTFSNAVEKAKIEVTITKKHWLYIGFNEVVGIVAKWLDKLILVYFLTPTEFAIFFNGSIEVPLFGILISVVGSVLLVEIGSYFNNNEKVIQIFRDTFLLLSNIVFPLFWFLFFCNDEIFHIVFDNKYNASISIFMLSILIIPLRINHYSSVLQCYNKAHIILRGSIFDILIAIVLMPILYYWLGIKGIALAIVISTYFQSCFYLHHSAQALKTTVNKLIPFTNLFFRFVFFFLLMGLMHLVLKNNDDLSKLIYAMVYTTLLILFSLFFYFRNIIKALVG